MSSTKITVGVTDLAAIEAAMQPTTRLIWLETPTNPLLCLADNPAVVALAHRRGILACVDNTFATPYAQRPLELGADIVVHSTQKLGREQSHEARKIGFDKAG